MSNYVKTTNFTSKDSLASGNPLKIVKGSEFDVEFNAIATAISSKADTDSPSFTGTPSIPTGTTGVTQSSSDSSTKIATTAFVQAVATAVKAALFPVGSIYTNATSSTNPATLLGFGTWTSFGAGRVMVGYDSSNALFDAAEETGGSADAIVVSHTHTATVTDPGHTHVVPTSSTTSSNISLDDIPGYTGQTTKNTNSATTGITVANSTTGSSGTNANYQPYITVYMWKRTA